MACSLDGEGAMAEGLCPLSTMADVDGGWCSFLYKILKSFQRVEDNGQCEWRSLAVKVPTTKSVLTATDHEMRCNLRERTAMERLLGTLGNVGSKAKREAAI